MTIRDLMLVGVLAVAFIVGCKGKEPAPEQAAPSATVALAAASAKTGSPLPTPSSAPSSEGADAACDISKPRDCETACLGGKALACGQADALLRQPGTTDNPSLRIKLNQKGCDLGDGKSCSRLGTQYDKGDGVAKNPAKAVENWERACAKVTRNGPA